MRFPTLEQNDGQEVGSFPEVYIREAAGLRFPRGFKRSVTLRMVGSSLKEGDPFPKLLPIFLNV